MIARCEKKACLGNAHVYVYQYRNLHNLPHWHMEHELVFVNEGTAEIMINNALYLLSEKQCAFIYSGEVHYIQSNCESLLSIIKIDAQAVETIVKNNILSTPVIENYYPFSEIFEEISNELSAKQEYCEMIADSLVIKLLAQIYRQEKTECYCLANNKTSGRYKMLLELIDEKYADITFNDAAAYMCMSRPYFSKYFHRISGMTFTRYLNIARVYAAVGMLSENKIPVTEIALQSGFGTIRSFNRVFKELTGYSPKALPKDYVFIGNPVNDSEHVFDPTLSASIQILPADSGRST